MNERANALAARFEQANADVIATVDRLSDADWQKTTGEGWTVAACAHHLAGAHEGIAGFVAAIAGGRASAPPGMSSIDEENARHAREYAACSRAEVLDLLRSGGAVAAAVVRGLSDEGLDRTTDAIPGMPEVSAGRLIEMALIGHLQAHHMSIKTTAGV